jgi:transcriptional repressor NrdR
MRRRRQCNKCTKRFTTYERVEGVDLTVLKKNGEKQSFDREKIRKGLMKATWKRPISIEEVESLIEEVERKLRLRETNEIKSWEIGKLVMNRLRKIDPVSYLLFASVYRDFQTIHDFEQEIRVLREEQLADKRATLATTASQQKTATKQTKKHRQAKQKKTKKQKPTRSRVTTSTFGVVPRVKVI